MTTPTRSFWRRLAQAATAPTTAGTTVTAPAGLASAMRPLALEQRFMFDGAAVDAAADAAHAASAAAAVAAEGG
ncbi:MAG: LEPR-XLL domain-containing protein, partial [Comamonas sp.]